MNVRDADFHVFDTAFGPCGLAWNERGLTRLLLPGADHASLAATLSRRAKAWNGESCPDWVGRTIAAVVSYFAGEPVELDAIAVDLGRVDDFRRRVYGEARRLGWGKTATYGDIARRIGEPPEAARDVGVALGRNPLPLVIPCHRVLAAGGKIGGFSAPGGVAAKARMLELEGIRVGVDPRQRSLFAADELLPTSPLR
jgi:methylated-DNA-[protein]-cysteine S-methyltransferase